MNSTAYLMLGLIGMLILLGAALAEWNHRAHKRKRDQSP
jgi:hypothetical protein